MKTVDVKTLRKWLDKDEAVLVDVREPAECAEGVIQNACLIPMGNVSLASLPDFEGKKLVVHCHKGGRSASVCSRLLLEDPSLDVYNLEGGISSWAAQGYPIVKIRSC